VRRVAGAFSWRGAATLVAVGAVLLVAGPSAAQRIGLVKTDDDRFADVCRQHGGTPSLAPGSGDYVKDARSCVVRYGAHTYEMYAVTPQGFNRREAARAHQACIALARSDAELGDRAGTSRRVWHPDTAICEAER
jgi:hypothetical protein